MVESSYWKDYCIIRTNSLSKNLVCYFQPSLCIFAHLLELIELISRLSVHRKFNSLFISPAIGGLEALLTLPHSNRSALAHCLYQLVSNAESMEQICLQRYDSL
jgi:hypothetical protein